MATGTGPFTTDDILNRVWYPAGTAPTANPDKLGVYITGGSAYVGSGSGQIGGQPFSVMQPAFRQFQLDGGTITGSGVGTTTTGLGGYRMIELYYRGITATGTISFLTLFVDSRLDGTNYVNIAQFGTLTSATAGTAGVVMKLIKSGGTGTTVLLGGELGGVDADAGGGTVRNIGWADDLRIRRDVSGGTTAPSFQYRLWVNAVS